MLLQEVLVDLLRVGEQAEVFVVDLDVDVAAFWRREELPHELVAGDLPHDARVPDIVAQIQGAVALHILLDDLVGLQLPRSLVALRARQEVVGGEAAVASTDLGVGLAVDLDRDLDQGIGAEIVGHHGAPIGRRRDLDRFGSC